jgi:sirohydrochlorin cobaltochelatase
MTYSTYTLIIAHGSRDSRWREPFESLIAKLQKIHGESAVGLAYMEMAQPTPYEVLQTLDISIYEHIIIVPLFMAEGAHVANDFAIIRQNIQETYPHLRVSQYVAMGEHPQVQALFERILSDIVTESVAPSSLAGKQ